MYSSVDTLDIVQKCLVMNLLYEPQKELSNNCSLVERTVYIQKNKTFPMNVHIRSQVTKSPGRTARGLKNE